MLKNGNNGDTGLRRSHDGLSGIIKDDYPGLPEELRKFNFYYPDGTGHVIMAVPECLLEKARENGGLDMFECPFPVKYVLGTGYRVYKDHIICKADYDPCYGLTIEDEWFEI